MSSHSMLRDLLNQGQSHSGQDKRQENRKPAGEDRNASASQPHKDDEEFVPVNHEDVEDVDDDDEDESEMERVLRPFLGLQRQLGQHQRSAVPSKYEDLHPYTQILGPSNVGQCVALEDAAFPEHERCSREKVSCSSSFVPHKPPLPKRVMSHVDRVFCNLTSTNATSCFSNGIELLLTALATPYRSLQLTHDSSCIA